MPSTLLSIIQEATDLIGVSRPSTVVASTDLQVRQLYALLRLAGKELAKAGSWQALVDEHTFTTVAAEEQTDNPLPSDLQSFMVGSFYDRTNRLPLIGPLSSAQWQALQAQPTTSTLALTFRQRSGTFRLSPVPEAGRIIAYDYVSSWWVKSSAGVAKEAFTSDDDETYLDGDLLVMSLVYRWKHAKGLEYGEDMLTYGRALEQALADDGGAPILNALGGASHRDDWRANIPDVIPVS